MTTEFRKAPPGIALLITLVILALLSVFMTEFTFNTNLETRGIRNFQSSFKARNAVKSLFKASLIGLEGGVEGEKLTELKFLAQVSLPPQLGGTGSYLKPAQPIELPPLLIKTQLPGLAKNFPNVTFFTPYIRPIDHLFNLNRINPKNAPGKNKDIKIQNEFSNIMETIRVNHKPDQYLPSVLLGLSPEAIQTLYASIYEWSDKGNELNYPNSSIEMHQDYDTEWKVKNAHFDKLEEITLLQNKLFQEGSFDFLLPLHFHPSKDEGDPSKGDSWDHYFTVFPVGDSESEKFGSPRINVNLANADEIEFFLNTQINQWLPQSDKEQHYLNRAKDIALLLQPPEQVKKIEYSSFDEIKNKLLSHPSTSDLNYYHKNFFILKSSWYQIHLVSVVDNVKAEVRAVVQLERKKNNKITIHDFQLR